MTNLELIRRILDCDDIQAAKVYRCMILGKYDFDNALFVDFVETVKLIDKNLKEKLDGQNESLAKEWATGRQRPSPQETH